MTLYEEITSSEERLPNIFKITKYAEEIVYHYCRQLDLEEDEVVDMLIRYMGMTENIDKFLKDIGQEFKSDAWIN